MNNDNVTNDVAITTNDEPPPSSEEPARSQVSSAATGAAVAPQPKQNPKWNDWRWQIRNRIRTYNDLVDFFPTLGSNAGIARVAEKYPMAITPYYASLIKSTDLSDPVYQMAVPQGQELFAPDFLHADPLEEEEDMPVPGLIHRYRDRALLMATTMCSMYCRHCTRKRVAGYQESCIDVGQLNTITNYLRAHPEVKDVVISGGDPMTMSTSLLERILAAVRSVSSVDIIRIGTRVPVVLPQRITSELTQMLSKYHPVWINTHFNHPNEITPEAIAACAKLANAGFPIGNQTVLLRGINDSPQVMEDLCRGLVKMRVRPYYLFQCDLVRGVEHFRTPISRGIEIMEYLRGRLSGLAIPTFVVDAPHGGGKIPVLPNYIISSSPTHTVLRNYEGMIVNYPEPSPSMPRTPPSTSARSGSHGVWEVAAGHSSAITPSGAHRQKRRAARKLQRGEAQNHPEFSALLESLMSEAGG
ncbi:MAG: KamA family radical SAM protein [bacterium]